MTTHSKNIFFFNKKTVVQFVLSLFVFFIHFQTFSAFSASGKLLSTLFSACSSFTHVAVPLFFLISGALFYRDYTPACTLNKWKNRFFTLCVPYLTWNSIWLMLAMLGHYTPLGAFLGGVKTAFSWQALFSGVFLHAFFEPFWFVLQLIMLTALSPILYYLLKNKWGGVITILAYFILSSLNLPPANILLPFPNTVLYYLIGSWIGIHSYESFAIRKPKGPALAAAVLFLLCSIYFGIRHLLPNVCSAKQITLIVTTISCAAFWTLFDLFDMKACPGFMSHSFLIYAMHSFIGAAASRIMIMILPRSPLSTVVAAVVTFPLTVCIICVFGKFLATRLPAMKRILSGR